MKSINKYLHTPIWLFILLSLVLVLRIPTLFEPYYYESEMVYLTMGQAIREGVPLYSGLYGNEPPLLYIAAAIAGNLIWLKALLTMWHLGTVYIFWRLTSVLFPKKERLQKVATVIFALFTTLPLLEGNVVNPEIFAIGPVMAAFYVLLSRKVSAKNIFISGLLFSIASLFKVFASFEILVILFVWVAALGGLRNRKSLRVVGYRVLILAAGFLTPILIAFVWFEAAGSFGDFLVAVYLQHLRFISSWGQLFIRGVVVLSGLAIIYLKRDKLSTQFVFITSWLLISLFAVTVSGKPNPHHFIQSIPAISLLLGIFLTIKTKEQILVLIPLTVAFLVPVFFGFRHYSSLLYYERFIKLTAGDISKEEYLRSFGEQVIGNYTVADYLKSMAQTEEKIFIWGDTSTVYALTFKLPPTKYLTDYQVRIYSTERELLKRLEETQPEYVAILPNSDFYYQLDYFFSNNYGLVEEVEGVRILKLLKPELRNLI
jgi:hypothetical protein